MGYSDQKYFSYDLDKVATAVAFGTATASGTSTLAVPAATYFPLFKNQNTIISAIELIPATAPNNKQGGLFQLLNGTNTLITATYTSTATVGVAVYGSYTGTYTCTGTATADKLGAVPANVFSTVQPTLQLVLNTATASGDTTGTWDVYFNDAAHV